MKVVIINRHRQDIMGGSELQCDFIATELTKRGYEVIYLAILGANKDYCRPYKVLSCESNSDAIQNKLINLQPDVIYWRYNKKHFYNVAKFAREKGMKFIFSASHLIDLDPWYFNKKTRVIDTLKIIINRINQHRGFKYIDALIVNNHDFLNILSFPKQFYIPNGMTDDNVSFNWQKPFIIWVANIKQQKRPELFVELAKEFSSKEIDFLMVGKIQDEAYNWLKNKTNLSSNLYYLGSKSFEEVNGIIKESLFHVHTCTKEGFPNIFIQAWLSGKATVSFGFDPSNYIRDYKLGFFSEENWGKFVNDVERMYLLKEERKELNSNSKSFAEEMFSIEKSVSKLEEVIHKLISDRGTL